MVVASGDTCWRRVAEVLFSFAGTRMHQPRKNHDWPRPDAKQPSCLKKSRFHETTMVGALDIAAMKSSLRPLTIPLSRHAALGDRNLVPDPS